MIAREHRFAGVTASVHMAYLEFRPNGAPPVDGWPLVIFLHGAGEKGGDLNQVRSTSIARLATAGSLPSFVIICPQCAAGPGWPIETLTALFDHVAAGPTIDPRRVCVTGISMGGRGTWELAYWRADRLAAIVPVCGFGIPNLAPLFSRLPIWAFHGEDDDVLPVARSREMISAVRACGGDAQLTILPGVGHDCSEHVYRDPELWRWIAAQQSSTGLAEGFS